MGQLRKNRSAFTLIELLVVVIIVAVLAAVGIPLLSANVDRARASEATAGLGTIRTSLRGEFVEGGGAYPIITVGTLAVTALPDSFNVNDLRGRFYDDNAYLFGTTTTATTFCVAADGSASTAPRAAEVAAIDRSMNQDGTIFASTNCTGAALN